MKIMRTPAPTAALFIPKTATVIKVDPACRRLIRGCIQAIFTNGLEPAGATSGRRGRRYLYNQA
jgi:hypothetical protein